MKDRRCEVLLAVRSRRRAAVASLPALLLLAAASVRAGDDFQSWHALALRWVETPHADMVASSQLRFRNNSSELSLVRFGQAVVLKPTPWLRAGLAYRYGEAKGSDGEFRDQHRGEVQLTPGASLTERLDLRLRNRFEVRATEGEPGLNERVRHRLRISFRTPGWEPLEAVFASDEIFYDFDRDRVSENRLVPVGIYLRLRDGVGLRLGYLLRSARSRGDWVQTHVMATTISLSL